MSRTCQSLLRVAERSAAASRSTRSARYVFTAQRTFASTSRARSPADEAGPSAPSPQISSLVDSISKLTLLEVSELVTALKTKLNITEIAVPAAAAPAAASAGAAAAEAPAEEKPKEKTIFTVKLEKIDAAQKAKVIREVKAINPTMNLVEAKKFVESAPQVLKDNVPKEDAEKLKATLEALGATVSLS